MRVKVEKPSLSGRVSVPRTYFDGENKEYSSLLPASITRIYGTVLFLYSTKARVQWDLDDQCNDVPFEDLTSEPSTTPYQEVNEIVLPGPSVDFHKVKECDKKVR